MGYSPRFLNWSALAMEPGSGFRGLARGAQAPECDYGFVDRKAVALSWLQAGGRTNDTVDIRHCPATPAREVVVVVANPVLVPRRSRAKINLAQQADFGKSAESFIYRLEGDVADTPPSQPGDLVGAGVVPRAHGVQDGQPRGCHTHPRSSEPVCTLHASHHTF